jgi:hypothetical protein
MPSSENRKRRFKAATASTILAAIIFAILFLGSVSVFGIDDLAEPSIALPAMVLAWSSWP